jgi:hypothetical protein
MGLCVACTFVVGGLCSSDFWRSSMVHRGADRLFPVTPLAEDYWAVVELKSVQ